jgi:hypothetical protein
MTNTLTYGFTSLGLGAATFFTSYDFNEDTEDTLQEARKEFQVTEFDRIELGDAFVIDVEQGNYFEVLVDGDRRNIDDLEVKKDGSTLVIRYNEVRNRRHDTYITITMPALVSVKFTGASDSRVSGFYGTDNMDFHLSGSSECQLDVNTEILNVFLSETSVLNIRGTARMLEAELSGDSVLKAFNFPVTKADLRVCGASNGYVSVSDQLNVVASGASMVVYRGNPEVTSERSGLSSVRQQ